MTQRPIRAVLFDVGGPLDTESAAEAYIDRCIREALAAQGVAVTDSEYAAANARAVATFAANAYQAIIWFLSRGYPGVAERLAGFSFPDRTHEWRPGMREVLRSLPQRASCSVSLRTSPLASLPRSMGPVSASSSRTAR